MTQTPLSLRKNICRSQIRRQNNVDGTPPGIFSSENPIESEREVEPIPFSSTPPDAEYDNMSFCSPDPQNPPRTPPQSILKSDKRSPHLQSRMIHFVFKFLCYGFCLGSVQKRSIIFYVQFKNHG